MRSARLSLALETGALTLPATAPAWRLVLDTTRPEMSPEPVGLRANLSGQAVFVFEPFVEKVSP